LTAILDNLRENRGTRSDRSHPKAKKKKEAEGKERSEGYPLILSNEQGGSFRGTMANTRRGGSTGRAATA